MAVDTIVAKVAYRSKVTEEASGVEPPKWMRSS